MSDLQTSQQDSTQESKAETTAPESATDKQTTSTDSANQGQQQDQTKASDESKDSKDAKSGSDASTGDQKQSKDEERKPKSRRSAQFRIEELARENAEYRKKHGPLPKKDDAADDDQDSGDQEDSTKPTEQQIQDSVKRYVDPLLKQSQQTADDAEINELFTGERAEHRAKYEEVIRTMWGKPQYRDVAAEDLFKIAHFEAAVAAAATKAVEDYKAAEKQAKDESTGGNSNSNRSGQAGKSVSEMSPEEFQKHNEAIKSKL